jgi:hypothetical protein
MPGSVRPTAPSTAKAGIAAARHVIAIQTILPEAFTIHLDSGASAETHAALLVLMIVIYSTDPSLFSFFGPQAPIAEG